MINAHKEWMAEISEIDEFFGNKARYPHTLLQSHIKKELDKQNRIIQNSNSEIKKSIINSTSNVCGTLENGFNLMANINQQGFEKLNSSVENLENTNREGFEAVVKSLNLINSTLNWGFSKIVELNKQRNILLDDIIGLLNIPDIEKVRKLNIEKGLDFFKKSTFDISFLNDSKEYFNRALEIEPNDYYVLYNLGLIHLFSIENLNFEKARDFFLKVGKYSNAEILLKSVNYSTHSSSFTNNINPKTISIYSFVYASRCFYNLGNYKDALETIKKAYDLDPNITEVSYDYSKYLALNKDIQTSIQILSKTIKKDRFITLKLIKDIDLIKHPEVEFLLNKFKSEALKEGNSIYNECEKNISENSVYDKELKKVHQLLKKENFLESMSALDILKN